MRRLHEIAIFQTVKSTVIISLFEIVRLSVSISLRNLYSSLNSIKDKTLHIIDFPFLLLCVAINHVSRIKTKKYVQYYESLIGSKITREKK